ncbi:calcium homeostasis modulator protein 6 [Meleagris gallopavo]|uniref:Calcium homeostasis modulator family member 6 n=1 Tax=Meleagris gallopavo TaxID=9103 RepID=G1NKZ5_MELGA|nr:calcium homeostasis modulator protein 6 [Meleagris gallopavo]
MEKLHTAVNFCIRYQKTLGYSIVSLLTIASEQIFSSVAFRCPCNSWNILYGCVFLLVPAILLFLLGYMVNARTWLLLTGSCPQEKKQCCGSWGKGCFYLKVLAPVTASILVAPLTWIAVALLSASFYECAASGSSFIRNQVCRDMDNPEACWELLEKIPCDEKVARQLLNENSTSKGGLVSFRAQSQILGWLLIVAIITVALISTCISRCFSPVSYFQLKFWKIYLEKEREHFETKAKEHAAQLAERNINCFFEATNPPPFQTPSNEDWKKISLPYAFSKNDQYYSMIHKYISANRDKISTCERDQFSCVLGFVDEAHINEQGF